MRVLSGRMARRASKTKVRELIDKAAGMFGGNDTRLAEACGFTQNAIWQARARGRVTGELAAAIHRATKGEVPAEEFRPDLWPLQHNLPREQVSA